MKIYTLRAYTILKVDLRFFRSSSYYISYIYTEPQISAFKVLVIG